MHPRLYVHIRVYMRILETYFFRIHANICVFVCFQPYVLYVVSIDAYVYVIMRLYMCTHS